MPYVLGPADLAAAAAAFQASLEVVDDGIDGVNTYRLRQLLARQVMEHALQGERDPERLRDAAVQHLELILVGTHEGRTLTEAGPLVASAAVR